MKISILLLIIMSLFTFDFSIQNVKATGKITKKLEFNNSRRVTVFLTKYGTLISEKESDYKNGKVGQSSEIEIELYRWKWVWENVGKVVAWELL